MTSAEPRWPAATRKPTAAGGPSRTRSASAISVCGASAPVDRDLERAEPGCGPELVEGAEREEVSDVVAEETRPFQAAAQLAHDRPLVDPEGERQLHARLAGPRNETVLGRDRPARPPSSGRRSHSSSAPEAIDRAPVDRDAVALVLDPDPARDRSHELVAGGLDHRSPARDAGAAAPTDPSGSRSSSPCRPMARKRRPVASRARGARRGRPPSRPETAATTASSAASS